MKLFRAFACAVACLASSAALAHPRLHTLSSKGDELVRSTGVKFSDLDLASPDGRRRLDARLRKAAVDVCRAPRSDGGVTGWFSVGCYKGAIADARTRARSKLAGEGEVAGMGKAAGTRSQ